MSKEGAKYVLDLIDKSIKKWQRVVIKRNHIYSDVSLCPLCTVFEYRSKCVFDHRKPHSVIPDPDTCPIYLQTGCDDCIGTSFYRTSIWAFIKSSQHGVVPSNFLNKGTRRADNQMLLFLHKIRKKQLLYLLKKIKES